jgi:hypothetical protein
MNEFMMNVAEYDSLLGKLLKIFDLYKVKYELENGRIAVNVVPADVHMVYCH